MKKVAMIMAVIFIASCQESNIHADEASEEIGNSERMVSEVQVDIVKPVIKGLKNRVVYVGTKKINYLAGVSAVDDVDGNLTSKIKVNKSRVNLKKVGTYPVVYSVSDSSGNTETVKKQVLVRKDEKPVIRGVKNRVVYLGTKRIDYLQGVTATDKRDGNLTKKVKVNKSKVNLNRLGTYTVTYSVTDRAKNKTVKTAKILVKSREYSVSQEPQGKLVLTKPKEREGGKEFIDKTKPRGKKVGTW